MLQVAFVLLCLAQMLHLSKHLWLLTKHQAAEAADQRVRKAVNWKT